MKISLKLAILLGGALCMMYTPEIKTYSVNQVKNEIVKNSNVIVYFYRSGCSFCSYLQPHINRLKSKLGNNVTYLAVNVDSNKSDFKKVFGLSSFPTVIYYKDGVKQESHGSENKRMTAPKMAQIVNKTYKTNITC